MFYIMAMNKEISSILLLVIIGSAIYCLCNSKSVSGMANVTPYQEEESESLIVDSEQINLDSVVDTPESIMPESIETASEVEPNTDIDNTVSETDIKSIIDSNCGPNLPSADSTIVESGSVSGSVSGSPSPNGVSSFSSATQGANIASAFNNPLPKGTNTDKVNFNQNNNKKYNAKDYLPDKKALKQIPKDKQFEGDFTSAKYKLEGESGLIPVQQFTIGAESGTSGSNKGSWWGIRGLGATFINPRFNVSAWNNSTRVPDNNRKPLSC